VTKTIARIIEARPEVDVAPLSDLMGLEYLFDVPLVASNPAIRGALRKKLGDVAKKAQGNFRWLGPQRPRKNFYYSLGANLNFFADHRDIRLKRRCLNPKRHKFRIYGVRGIKVCDRWRDSYKLFLAEHGPQAITPHTRSIASITTGQPASKGAVAASRAGGEAIVAVVSNQLVFKVRIAGRGAIREQLRDRAFGPSRNEPRLFCSACVCVWLVFELLFRFGND